MIVQFNLVPFASVTFAFTTVYTKMCILLTDKFAENHESFNF